MIDRNGQIVNLTKCCILYSSGRLYNYEVKSDKELTPEEVKEQNLVLIGKGRRTNNTGGHMTDVRLVNENPEGYFYKKQEVNNES